MLDSRIGYIICESYTEPDAKLTAKTINGKVVGEAVLQEADEKNRNGRYYAEEELFPQLTAPRTVELLRTGTLRAECGHPLSKDLQRQSTIDDTRTCARFLKLWTEGKKIKSHFVGTNNELGRAFDLDLKEGVLPAWSLRALGSVEQTRRGCEVRNLRLITWDNVIYPSHPGAYTQGLVMESGALTEADKKSNLQAVLATSNMKDVSNQYISECIDVNGSGMLIPMNNEDVIKYLQSESANLKFIRECFDFVYSGVNVDKSGTRVILTTNEGESLVINMEHYIHNNLMDYHKFQF